MQGYKIELYVKCDDDKDLKDLEWMLEDVSQTDIFEGFDIHVENVERIE